MTLAMPSVVSFASITVTGMITLMILGQLGAVATAVVGVVNILMYNVFALFSGIGHTVNYLVAQNYGSETMKQGIQRTYAALYLTLFVVVLIMAAGFLFSDELLRLIGGEASKELVVGNAYLELRFYAMAFGIVNFIFHGFFRGVSDTVTPMVLSIGSNVLVIGLTFLLTYGMLGFPEWGLTGAGWAFLIGEAAGTAGCLYIFFVKMHRAYFTRKPVAFHRRQGMLIFKESGKLGIQEFALSISMLIFTIFVARLGPVALAANEVALNVMSIGFMPAFAFGATATLLVGREIGRGRPLEARRLGTDTAVLGTLFMLGLGAIEFLFPTAIASIYSPDPAVYELAGRLILISAFLQLFDGWLNFYAGGLRGIGDTSFLLVASLLLGLGLFVPMAYTFIFWLDWGSIGAWLALYIFLILFGLSVMIRFYRTDWIKVRMKGA